MAQQKIGHVVLVVRKTLNNLHILGVDYQEWKEMVKTEIERVDEGRGGAKEKRVGRWGERGIIIKDLDALEVNW